MKDFQIFDDLLSIEEMDQIEQFVCDPNFTYFRSSGTIEEKDFLEKYKGKFQDIRYVYHLYIKAGEQNSSAINVSTDLLDKFLSRTNTKIKGILRVQTNLTFQTTTGIPTVPHVDTASKHFVLLYYVNDSDGGTILYQDGTDANVILKKIEYKRGRFILFDGSIYHSQIPCSEHKERIVFNYNLIMEDVS